MKKTRLAVWILAFMTMTASFSTFAASDLERKYKPESEKYGVRIDFARSMKDDKSGSALTESEMEKKLTVFFNTLAMLEPSFIRKSRVKVLVVKSALRDRKNNMFSAISSGEELMLDKGFTQEFVLTTMFKMNEIRPYFVRWGKLNPKGFIYYDKRTENMSERKLKELEANVSALGKNFVSAHATQSVEEDMSETFAYMLIGGPGFVEYCKKECPALKKKIDLMIEITDENKMISRTFWDTALTRDITDLKNYSPVALCSRFYREYGVGVTLQIGYGDSMYQLNDAYPVRHKMTEVIHIGGKTVIPLILALTQNDTRLVDRLVSWFKVNVNVFDEKNRSALMLAIGNNNPEQVRLILSGDPPITPEALRAGTEPGANPEIAEMIKAAAEKAKSGGLDKEKSAEESDAGKTDGQ